MQNHVFNYQVFGRYLMKTFFKKIKTSILLIGESIIA